MVEIFSKFVSQSLAYYNYYYLRVLRKLVVMKIERLNTWIIEHLEHNTIDKTAETCLLAPAVRKNSLKLCC